MPATQQFVDTWQKSEALCKFCVPITPLQPTAPPANQVLEMAISFLTGGQTLLLSSAKSTPSLKVTPPVSLGYLQIPACLCFCFVSSVVVTQAIKLACNEKQKAMQFAAQKSIRISSVDVWSTTL